MIRTMKDTCLHFCRWTVGLAICVCLLAACSDDWNNHYGKDESLPTASLMQQIAAEEDLSLFMRMLELTGLDSVLSSSQTYTVWAPVDAALETLDMSRYKMCVFLNALLLPESIRACIEEKLRGKTKVFLYGPGLWDGKSFHPAAVSRLCGMKIVRRAASNSTARYLDETWHFTGEITPLFQIEDENAFRTGINQHRCNQGKETRRNHFPGAETGNQGTKEKIHHRGGNIAAAVI